MCFTNIVNTANKEAQGDTYFVKTGQLCIEEWMITSEKITSLWLYQYTPI